MDVWRGVAIVLVVIGHAIQRTVGEGFDANIVYRAIYSFHMPLFFLISGIVLAGSVTGGRLLAEGPRRAGNLVVPFVAWGLLPLISRAVLGGDFAPKEWLLTLLVTPSVGPWYLLVLFLVWVIALAAVMIRPSSPFLGLSVASLVLYTCGRVFPAVEIVNLVAFHFPVFAAGVVLHQRLLRADVYTVRTTAITASLTVLAFVIMVAGWRRTGLTVPARWWSEAGFPGAPEVDVLYRYCSATVGIVLSLFAVRLLMSRAGLAERMRWLGVRTCEIYVAHGWVLRLFDGVGAVWAPIAAVVGATVSLVVASVLKRFAFSRVLLYGGRQ